MVLGHTSRCCYIAGKLPEPLTPEEQNQLREWSRELDARAEALGEALFPLDMLEHLAASKIRHVVLIPEPSLPLLPYAALKTRRGFLLDEPWTLSLATSAMDIPRFLSRAGDTCGPLVWMGPDADVNQNRGGFLERDLMARSVQLSELIGQDASVESARRELEAGKWVHIRSHGRWTGDHSTSGPVLSDGVLSVATLADIKRSGGFVVTSACRTGVADSVGLEPLGSIVNYDAVGLRGAVLTAWPVDGVAAAWVMDRFYEAVAQQKDLATALADAAKATRSALPHPYFWAPFQLFGNWKA